LNYMQGSRGAVEWSKMLAERVTSNVLTLPMNRTVLTQAELEGIRSINYNTATTTDTEVLLSGTAFVETPSRQLRGQLWTDKISFCNKIVKVASKGVGNGKWSSQNCMLDLVLDTFGCNTVIFREGAGRQRRYIRHAYSARLLYLLSLAKMYKCNGTMMQHLKIQDALPLHDTTYEDREDASLRRKLKQRHAKQMLTTSHCVV